MRPAKTFRVVDRSALTSLLRRALHERFDDSMARACRALRAPRARWSLTRVLEGKTGRVNNTLLGHLRRLICTDKAITDAFQLALIPPGVRLHLHRYRWWRDTGGHAWATGAREVNGRLRHVRRWVSAVKLRERARRLTQLEEQLEGDEEVQRIWRRFVNRAKDRGHCDERIALAWRRTIEPLLADIDTGGIERGWSEMTRSERKSFLTHMTEAELLLLDRAHDLDRALANTAHGS